MARMKTFLMYALVLIGFIFLSYVLENGLIQGMYKPLTGDASNGPYSQMSINDVSGRASNVNGYLNFRIKNESNETVNCYGKIDLFSKQNLLAATEYVEILDFKPSEEKDYTVKFKANEIASYNISLVSELPDKSNIINLFGWEIDLTDFFGKDISNLKLFGVKLKDLCSWSNLKSNGQNAWNWIKIYLASIPWWGYAIGAGIVLWYMPTRYLFGIFPL